MNMIIDQYLRSFMHRRSGRWGKLLLWVEWSHNTSWNMGTGSTPYEITFGRKPFNFSEYLLGSSNIDAVDDMLTHRDEVFHNIRKKLLKAQATMKHQADSRRREVIYQPGDWVLLKLRPYRQQSAKEKHKVYGKLVKCYYGPFQILERVGPVACRLKLPEGALIHSVFHCSLLKPFHVQPDAASLPEFLEQFFKDQPVIFPLAVLNYRQSSTTEDGPREVLVQWCGLSPDETSWENWDQLKRDHHLEDKVIFQGPREDDSMINTELAEHKKGSKIAEKEVQTARAKRRITKPSYLRDYI